MDAAAWDALYADPDRLWPDTPGRWVHEVLAHRPPGRALDLACGEGRNAVWLAEQGWEVTAVDYSAAALERAAAAEIRHAVHVHWVQADVTTWTPPQPVDLVLISYLHLPAQERRGVLRTAAAALAPGGTLLVIGHDAADLTRGFGGPRDVSVVYTAQDVLDDLADAGLEPVRGVEVPRPTHGTDAGDVVVELRRAAEEVPA
ncbi:class I SAM-dependent methyltransferase [Actinomycetospora straminea]|uniref:Class I SAM-dependent methyltransferase n=1 Tax=Actinomycetospora straminea TaxID=663607 RepID=A0ABP9EZ25_9PSEU|nr:class I SAM-dependent methyltransferase [Actinomycetospora straminea]MDD7935781.1 class I SAM-dependent methyltransferase [Actinomycetospora straminea]